MIPLLSVNAQSITGSWSSPPISGEHYEKAVMIFTADGYFFLDKQYEDSELFLPEQYIGTYKLEGNTLKIYELKNVI